MLCIWSETQFLFLFLQAATTTAEVELPPTHPIRLGLALNFSVFYYEIMNSPERFVGIECISFCILVLLSSLRWMTFFLFSIFLYQGLPPCQASFWWSYCRAWHPQWGVLQRQHLDRSIYPHILSLPWFNNWWAFYFTYIVLMDQMCHCQYISKALLTMLFEL